MQRVSHAYRGLSTFPGMERNLTYFISKKLHGIADKFTDGKIILPNVIGPNQGSRFKVLARANSTRTIKVRGDQTDGRIMIMEGNILIGEAPPFHVHRREDEYFHVLKGELQFEIGDAKILAKEGTWVCAPRFIKHRFRNLNSPEARLEYVFQPAGIEYYFEEVSRIIVAQENGWEDAAAAVAKKYGLDLLDSPDWTG